MRIDAAPATQPIEFVLRPDLQISTSADKPRRHVVKDPISLHYFHLRDEERTLLEMLDGSVSLSEMQARYQQDFAPRRISQLQIHRLVSQANENGLLLSRSTSPLVERPADRKQQRRSTTSGWGAWLAKLLVWRFRGINPDALLTQLLPYVRFAFHPIALVLYGLMMLSALGIVLTDPSQLRDAWPEFHQMFALRHVVWMLCLFATVKVLHELGHAFTCKFFGGECHELGVILVLGMPLLYCNVTDSWMLVERWKRVAISAAGVIVELLIAVIATFVWWCSEPGSVHTLSYWTMVVCSLHTLVVNANPLLRFDGYFMLADYLGVPNLWTRARSALVDAICRAVMGERSFDRGRSEPWWLLAYAIASLCYRCLVLIAIIWLEKELFAMAKIGPLFPLFAVLTVAGWSSGGLIQLANRMQGFTSDRPRAVSRAVCVGLFVTSVLVALVWLPVPSRVYSHATIQLRNAQPIYVVRSGHLSRSVDVGQRVHVGDVIAELSDPRLQSELIAVESELKQRQGILRALQASATYDAQARLALPTALQDCQYYQQRLAELNAAVTQLTIHAPCDGIVVPHYRTREPNQVGRLDRWAGSPLEGANHGCFVRTGTVLCLVAGPSDFEAILNVDDRDVALLRAGQKARFCVDGVLSYLSGEVADISRSGELLAVSTVDDPRTHSLVRPLQTMYEVRIRLESTTTEHLLHGMRAAVSVAVAPETISTRVTRWTRQLIRNS